ncbi:MAG: peptide ABC transporter substrate-binding protein [Anaerolineae bacterium]
MKRSLLFIVFALVALFVVACQPQVVTETVEVIKEVEVEVIKEVEVEKEVEVVKEVEVEVVKEVEVEVGSTARGAGDRLTLLYWQAPSTLNPYQSGGTKEQEASSLVLEPLARFDDTGKMVPYLAAEIPTLANGGFSADLTTITWSLKEGVMWSDGTSFTADDVVFTYEYCIDPATGCGTSDKFEAIDTITAIDDYTVEIIFKDARPYPYEAFITYATPILQRAQFQDCVGAAAAQCTDENFMPVGTGPYAVAEFLSNDSVLYLPNEFYRDENKPFFSEVFMKGGGSAEDAARAVLETNEADYAWNTQVPPEVLANMELAGNGKVLSALGTSVERILINFTNNDPGLGDDRSLYLDGTNPHPFLSDIAVRQALSMAIDRNTLTTIGYGTLAKPTCNILPGPPSVVSTANDGCLAQDIAGANALLDEAGIIDTDGDGIREKDGVPLVMLYQTSTNAVRQQYQALIKQWWAEIGVETELRNIDASVFFGGDPSSPDTYAKFYADVQMYTSGAAGQDFAGMFSSWLPNQMPGPDNAWGASNIMRYINDDFVAAYDELAVTGDADARNELLKTLNDTIVQDYGVIPITYRGSVSAAGNDVLGVRINPWDSELWNIADWTRSSQ